MKRFAWIAFVSQRWFAARREGGGGLGSLLAAAGIGIGVAALVVVLGVMNGFQLGYIDSLLEVGSFHARIEAPPGRSFDEGLAKRLAALPGLRSILPFAETQVLLFSPQGSAQPLKLRLMPKDAARRDPGLARALGLPSAEAGGIFAGAPGLVLGAELARYLGLERGDIVQLVAVGASAEEGVEAQRFELRIAGVFRSGYYDFDFGLGLLPLEELPASLAAGPSSSIVYGVKLERRFADAEFRARAEALLASEGLEAYRVEGWRDYNRAFFGALRTEKTVMMLLVGLIFAVVGVNIYHAMRRAVIERTEDISVLRALGASPEELKTAFVLDGLAIGAAGAFAGLLLGLLIAVNINEVFALVESLVNGMLVFLSRIAGGGEEGFRVFSPQYFYLTEVPVRVLFPETLFVVAAAIASAAAAAGSAAAQVSSLHPAEVLRYE